MRKIFYILISALSSLHSFSQGYFIKGKIKGLRDTVVYLGNHYGNKQYVKDTTKVDKDGNFVFEGNKKLDGGIYLIVLPNKKYFEIIIDKEQNFYIETDTSSEMAERMKIKGSEDNIAFYKYIRFISEQHKKADPIRKRIQKINEDTLAAKTTKKDSLKMLQDKISEIDKEVKKYKENYIKANPGTFFSVILKAQDDVEIPEAPILPNGRKDSSFPYRYYKTHYWDNVPLSDDRLLRSPILHNKLKYYLDKVVVQHQDSIIKESDMLVEKTAGNKETFKYVVWYITTTYETSQIMCFDAVFVHMVEKYYVTWKAYWVDSVQNQKIIHRGMTLKPLLCGKPAPPIIMQDTLNRNVSLYEIKSKYTIVVFWDPDCGHCQKIVPKLNEVYNSKLKAKGVTIFAVDIEDAEDKWKNFIREKNLNFINVRDKYRQYYLRQLYDIYSSPVIYLLDENKRIKGKRLDVDQLEGFIDFLDKQKK